MPSVGYSHRLMIKISKFYRFLPSHHLDLSLKFSMEVPKFPRTSSHKTYPPIEWGLFLILEFLTYMRHVCAIFIDHRSRSYARLFHFSSNPMTVDATLYLQHPVFPIIFLDLQVYIFRGGNQGIRKDGYQVSKTPLFFITAQDSDASTSWPIQCQRLLVTYGLANSQCAGRH